MEMLEVRFVCVIVVMMCGITSALDYEDIFDDQPLRILGLNLRDEACDEQGRVGSCQPWDRCLKLHGVHGESCAYGFGVCCYWQTSCGAQTSFKVSQFVNPSYPGSDTLDGSSGTGGVCRFTVRVSDKRVCQLRLDLDAFQLSEPEVRRSVARCTKQRFQVRGALGSNLGFVELCGDNTGQHLYIPVEASLGPTTVQLIVSTLRGASAYRWKIRVSQVDCSKDKKLTAPTGCLQYYKGDRGSFRSLGYGRPSGYRGVPRRASMPSGLDYAVCIQRSSATCGVLYSSLAFNLPAPGNASSEGAATTTPSTTTLSTTTPSTTTPSTITTTTTRGPQTEAPTATMTGSPTGGRIRTGKAGSVAVAPRALPGLPRATPVADLGPPFVYIPGGVYQGEGSAAGGEDGKFSGDSLSVAAARSAMPGPISVWVNSGRGGLNVTGFELDYELLTTNC